MEKLVHTGYAEGKSSLPIKVYVTYTTTQNVSNNTSTITCGMYVTSPSSSYDIGPWTDYNGSYVGTKSLTFSGTIPNFAGTRTLASGKQFTVNHNPDGTGSATIYWHWGVNSAWGKVQNPSGSFTITLPTIPRQATLTAAPNFNDEQNPTITYSNLAGNNVTTLQACVASADGKTIYVPYRDISKTGTSYTFSLTSTERTSLRNATPNSNTLKVNFYVKTIIGETTYYSSLTKTLTITNANPTLSPVVEDRGSVSTTLTGDKNKIIKNYNNVYAATGAVALKGATIKSQKITCGGTVINAASGTFYYADTATVSFEVTDSRGNKTTKTVTKTLIPYVILTCNISDNRPDTTGNMTVKCSGNYYNGSFGAVTNTLTVEYRYKVKGGSYGEWTAMSATKSGNTYTATKTLTGLDYKTSYVFQTRAIDKIYVDGINSVEYSVKTTPIFDWGENDFAFNVPVKFDGKEINVSQYRTDGANHEDPNTTTYPLILTSHENAPMTGNFFFIQTFFYSSRSSSGNRSQIAIGYTSNKRFGRYCYNGTWSNWGVIADTAMMTVMPSARYTVSGDAWVNITLNCDYTKTNTSNGLLTTSGGGIRIGKNVNTVKISGRIAYHNYASTGEVNLSIYKNTTQVVHAYGYSVSGYINSNVSNPIGISVTEGDVIYLKIYKNTDKDLTIINDLASTSLTVEVLT